MEEFDEINTAVERHGVMSSSTSMMARFAAFFDRAEDKKKRKLFKLVTHRYRIAMLEDIDSVSFAAMVHTVSAIYGLVLLLLLCVPLCACTIAQVATNNRIYTDLIAKLRLLDRKLVSQSLCNSSLQLCVFNVIITIVIVVTTTITTIITTTITTITITIHHPVLCDTMVRIHIGLYQVSDQV